MKPKKRQKLCYHCEGEVDVDVIVCPFCAADLRQEREGISREEKLAPLYPPPYKSAADAFPKEEFAETALPREESKEGKAPFIPIVLFTLGVQLCLLGLLMLLFSHKGMVILKWDARFWFLYVGVSIPFLIFGYRALAKV